MAFARPLTLCLCLLSLALMVQPGIAQEDAEPVDVIQIPTTDQRIAAIERKLREAPADSGALVELGREFEQKFRETGDGSYIARAEAVCQKALKADPTHYPAIRQLPGIYNVQHRFGEAVETARRAIEINRGDYINHARLGDALLELGDYAEAEEAYLLLTFRAPRSAWLPRMARLRELHGDTASARALLEAAVELSGTSQYPEHRAWIRVQLGNLLLNSGKFEEAEGRFADALKEFASYHLALNGMAQVRVAQERFEEAAELYRRSMAIAPLYDAVVALGDVYHHIGKDAEAKRQFELVKALEKLNQANNIRGDTPSILFLLDHGQDSPGALKMAREQAKERRDVRTLDALAWALHKNGLHEEALGAIAEALRLGTRDALMEFHRGIIQAKLGQHEHAAATLERALSINSKFHIRYAAEARRMLGELEK